VLELAGTLDQGPQFVGRKLLAGYEMARLVHMKQPASPDTQLTFLSWNVFHGRDAPPDPAIERKAWWMSATPLDNGTYLQVNQSLEKDFVEKIASASWSVCLLQEVPPAWMSRLARRCGAETFQVLTSRNQLACITRLIGGWRPDLLGAWEGGSNAILVRSPWRIVSGSRRSLLLSSITERGLSERRRMMFARLRANGGQEICVANLHASAKGRPHAEHEVIRAAKAAHEWSRGAPLVFGGDFNLRPVSSKAFEGLAHDFGLTGSTDPKSIDHLLSRGFEVVHRTTSWPDARRELEVSWRGARRWIRLSDHPPIETTLGISV
jgi:endonuclease/exonuclease/phosphatase family metal-dependent hydrolase